MDTKDRLGFLVGVGVMLYGMKNGFDYIFDTPLVRRAAGTDEYPLDVYGDKDFLLKHQDKSKNELIELLYRRQKGNRAIIFLGLSYLIIDKLDLPDYV